LKKERKRKVKNFLHALYAIRKQFYKTVFKTILNTTNENSSHSTRKVITWNMCKHPENPPNFIL